MYLNNKVYDVLRWIAQFLLPGLAALYFALSDVWGLPYTGEVVGSIVALDTFLGTILGISTLNYNKAQVNAGYMYGAEVTVDWPEDTPKPTRLSGNTYDILKWTVMIFMPATGTLYFALSMQWNLPYGEEVLGTIAALTTFSGLLLGVSTKKFKDG